MQITVTMKENNRFDRSMTLEFPDDLPLTETSDCYYSMKHVFSNILYWMTYSPDTINQIMPDCEECEIEACKNCEYKRDSLKQSANDEIDDDSERNCVDCLFFTKVSTGWICDADKCKDKSNFQPKQKEPPIITPTEEKETEMDCDTCRYEDGGLNISTCDNCIMNSHWQPK